VGICCDHDFAELSAQRRECGDITNDLSRDHLGFDRIFREPSLFPLSVVTRGFTTPMVMRKRSTAADMRNPTALALFSIAKTDGINVILGYEAKVARSSRAGRTQISTG